MQKSRKNVPNGATLEVWVDPNIDSAKISALAGFGESFEQAFESKAEINTSSEAQPVQYLLVFPDDQMIEDNKQEHCHRISNKPSCTKTQEESSGF